jgi:hypothetical protein
MPDKYGFDKLDQQMHCTECGVRGPLWRWTEHERDNHHKLHLLRKREMVEKERGE